MTIKEFIQLKKEKADPFLKLFPLNYRGPATNFILNPIRVGIEQPENAIQYLEQEFRKGNA